MEEHEQPVRERGLRAQGFRFLIGGGANTALSYCVYWLLLNWLPYGTAFTLSYIATLFSGFAINSYFVFGVSWSWKRFAAFPLVHVVNYLAGLGIVALWVSALGLNEKVAPVAATLVTLPLNFAMTRFVIHRKASD